MILDKTKAVGANQTAFVTTTSNNEIIVKQVAGKSNWCCGSNSYFSETEPAEIWKKSQPANADHPYLKAKKVKPYKIRQRSNELIVPMYNCKNELQNLQRIFPDGKKLFLPGKPTKRCFHVLGTPESSSTIYMAEGYATAASIHEATEKCVVIAFSANNLPEVAEVIKWKYPDAEIIICADNDTYNSDKNIGLDKATEAAELIDAKLATPSFKDSSTKPKDFNDLANLEGFNEVRRQIAHAAKINANSDNTNKTSDDTINELAKLSLMEYGKIRKQVATRLNITVSILDTAVKAWRQTNSVATDAKSELEVGIKPWSHSVDSQAIANEIQSLIKNHGKRPTNHIYKYNQIHLYNSDTGAGVSKSLLASKCTAAAI